MSGVVLNTYVQYYRYETTQIANCDSTESNYNDIHCALIRTRNFAS